MIFGLKKIGTFVLKSSSAKSFIQSNRFFSTSLTKNILFSDQNRNFLRSFQKRRPSIDNYSSITSLFTNFKLIDQFTQQQFRMESSTKNNEINNVDVEKTETNDNIIKTNSNQKHQSSNHQSENKKEQTDLSSEDEEIEEREEVQPLNAPTEQDERSKQYWKTKREKRRAKRRQSKAERLEIIKQLTEEAAKVKNNTEGGKMELSAVEIVEGVKVSPSQSSQTTTTTTNNNIVETKAGKVDLENFDPKKIHLLSFAQYERTQQKKAHRKKWKEMRDQVQFYPPKIVIDCSYEGSLTYKELKSTAVQITYAYGQNKRLEKPLDLTLTGLQPRLREIMLTHDGFEKWKISITDKSFKEVIDLSKAVYLSPEADDVLTEMNEETTYIIGGIVDHNRLKGLSFRTAGEAGIKCARLPIEETMGVKLSNSLAINQVFSILSSFWLNKDWKVALDEQMPNRPGFRVVKKRGREGSDEDGKQEEENDNNNDASNNKDTKVVPKITDRPFRMDRLKRARLRGHPNNDKQEEKNNNNDDSSNSIDSHSTTTTTTTTTTTIPPTNQ